MAFLTSQRRREINASIVSSTNQHSKMDSTTLGIVVDTNDPQQMGRVRAMCQRWGDTVDHDVNSIPWAVYVSPFGGQTLVGSRGPGIQESQGGIAYGMWAIPKIGAQVIVMCIDSDPNQRAYFGCVYDQHTPHTLPHGRFMYDDHPALDATTLPAGPYTSQENPIEPLNTNLKQAFGNKSAPNYEWQNRAADYTASALDIQNLSSTASSVADDKNITKDGWESQQGYAHSRIDPDGTSSYTDKNYDSQVYSFTSPGFHSFSMDDRMENCRVRIRTTSGHQIIMDDTNERIYIATAKGENWIEMDQGGNIDIFASNKVNIRSKEAINMTSDDTIRMHAAKGIHMYSGAEVCIQAVGDINVKTTTNIRAHAGSSLYLQSDAEINVLGGSNLNLNSGSDVSVLAGGNIIETGAAIHFNGPSAPPASPAAEQPAKWTSRIPDHEPFARVMTKDDFSHDPDLAYTDANVNRMERGKPIPRGLYWRR
jgi:hypothetical protein